MIDAEEQPIENKEFLNKYILNKVLGKGSNSTIFKATCRTTGEKVACKLLKETKHDEVPDEVKVLEVASGLSEGVIGYKEYFQGDNETVIIMEFDENYITLQEYLRIYIQPGNTDNEKKFKIIVSQIVKTLATLLANNIQHGDVSTFNILINPITLKTKLIDFGFGVANASFLDNYSDLKLFKHLVKKCLKFMVSKDGDATEKTLKSELSEESWNFYERVHYLTFKNLVKDAYLELLE